MIHYDMETIGIINFFEKVTRADVKDCFYEGDTLVFVIQPGQLRQALGKDGEKIKKISFRTKKKVRIIEFSQSPEKFVLNLVYPLKPEVSLEEDTVVLKAKDGREKGLLFGRERSRLKWIQGLVEKYYKIKVRVE